MNDSFIRWHLFWQAVSNQEPARLDEWLARWVFADDAVRLSYELGLPVVLKLYSEVITHKTDVDGVKLNLQTEGEIREAYQAIDKEGSLTEAGIQQYSDVSLYSFRRRSVAEVRAHEARALSGCDRGSGAR